MTKITLNEANSMVQQGVTIRQSFKNVLPTFCTLSGDQLGINYTSGDFNAFIFSRDNIMRYFDDDNIVDTEGKKIPGASHLIVVVGAQINNGSTATEQAFKPGDLTVIAAGVNKITSDNYVCLNIAHPADEHTPRTAITELSLGIAGTTELKFNLL